ncbi:MAG: pyridine nucleotide-disulfide oxidoreductase [Gammaproteobacteria bacterium]|nr:pyridine nucleotide-disulfide oxidoreductase [Gammaproteobacteria bacterium]
MTENKHQVIIVGGGTAGITVAAALKRKSGNAGLDIAIIEPSDNHYYQPAFTLVGAGAYSLDKTQRQQSVLIPDGVDWIKDRVSAFDPDNKSVSLESGDKLQYDFLIVCPGLELNWDKIEGAPDALGKNGVCSNYSPEHVEYTWSCIKELKPGSTALFTQAPLPFKCPGAPQKIAYLTADYLQKQGCLEKTSLHFLTHGPAMFAVPLFAKELNGVAERYGIKVHFQHNLIAIDGANKKATFELVGGEKEGERITLDYDMLHFTPPQSPPESVRVSPLANEAGYVDVHQHSLQHNKYSNVFALGDAASTPNSKTAAAVRKQAPVVVRHLLAVMKGESLNDEYDGYGSCPLTTAYGKVIMAEFIYGGKVTPTFPLDPRKERWLNWWIKASGLPLFYWHYMLKGYSWFFKHNTDYVDPT